MKGLTIKAGLLLGFVMLSSVLMAQSKGEAISVTDLQKVMLEKTASLESVKCDFKQSKHLQYLDAVVESSGQLIFDKNNRLRWEYSQPFEYLIVINDGKFSIKSDGRTNEYDIESNKIFSEISDLIISSVNGTIFTDAKFKVEAYEQSKEYLIYLEPSMEDMKQVVSKIEMRVDKSDFSVNKVMMFEKADDFTEINFINKEFNAKLSDSTFICD